MGKQVRVANRGTGPILVGDRYLWPSEERLVHIAQFDAAAATAGDDLVIIGGKRPDEPIELPADGVSRLVEFQGGEAPGEGEQIGGFLNDPATLPVATSHDDLGGVVDEPSPYPPPPTPQEPQDASDVQHPRQPAASGRSAPARGAKPQPGAGRTQGRGR